MQLISRLKNSKHTGLINKTNSITMKMIIFMTTKEKSVYFPMNLQLDAVLS